MCEVWDYIPVLRSFFKNQWLRTSLPLGGLCPTFTGQLEAECSPWKLWICWRVWRMLTGGGHAFRPHLFGPAVTLHKLSTFLNMRSAFLLPLVLGDEQPWGTTFFPMSPRSETDHLMLPSLNTRGMDCLVLPSLGTTFPSLPCWLLCQLCQSESAWLATQQSWPQGIQVAEEMASYLLFLEECLRKPPLPPPLLFSTGTVDWCIDIEASLLETLFLIPLTQKHPKRWGGFTFLAAAMLGSYNTSLLNLAIVSTICDTWSSVHHQCWEKAQHVELKPLLT